MKIFDPFLTISDALDIDSIFTTGNTTNDIIEEV